MKKKFLCFMSLAVIVVGLSACNADSINSTINKAAGKAGVDVDVNITQDQIDNATGKIKDAASTVKDVVTDPKVKDSAKQFLDDVKDSANKSKNKSE